MKWILEYLSKNNSVTELNLGKNNLTSANLKEISKIMKIENLSSLILSDNALGDNCIIELSKTFKKKKTSSTK